MKTTKSDKKIKEAYKILMFKQEPDKIQIKNLCEIAEVNRSTFYDRYGFLDNLEKEIIAEEMGYISIDKNNIYKVLKDSISNKITIKKYIELFCNNKILSRLCTVNNREKYIHIIVTLQTEILKTTITELSYYEWYFLCLGALATVIEWINNKQDTSIDDLVDIIHIHSIAMFNRIQNLLS